MKHVCDNCRFRLGNACRVSDPTVFPQFMGTTQSPAESVRLYAYWPPIGLEDWCGKWKWMHPFWAFWRRWKQDKPLNFMGTP